MEGGKKKYLCVVFRLTRRSRVRRRNAVGFQFWLTRGEWRRMPDRKRKRVPDHGSDVVKGYVPCWAVQRSWFARVNALCNLSRKMSWETAASLPGRFLSRRCFVLCITMEVEPRIVKQYKCHHCCSCKNYQEKAMEGRKKVSLCHFLADQKIAILWKKCIWGHPIGRFRWGC